MTKPISSTDVQSNPKNYAVGWERIFGKKEEQLELDRVLLPDPTPEGFKKESENDEV